MSPTHLQETPREAVNHSSIRLLALSSSRAGGSAYLEAALPFFNNFLGNAGLHIAFVPFAAVDREYERYASTVGEALSALPHTIHTVLPTNARELITQCDVVMVGGGNTFKLLHDLYACDLLGLIRHKAAAGMPYIGWSAGANIAGRTIATTNDMPIIEPPGFRALQLLPFQINPHYVNLQPAGFHGETRDQRLAEFVMLNPTVPVVCLPEGTALQREQNELHYLGACPGVLLRAEKETGRLIREEIAAGTSVSFLLNRGDG